MSSRYNTYTPVFASSVNGSAAHYVVRGYGARTAKGKSTSSKLNDRENPAKKKLNPFRLLYCAARLHSTIIAS